MELGKRAERTYDSMEFTPLVPLWPAEMVLRLARTELAEVLGRAGHDVSEELELDSA